MKLVRRAIAVALAAVSVDGFTRPPRVMDHEHSGDGRLLEAEVQSGSGSIDSGSGGAKICQTISVYFLKSELSANYTQYANGGGFDVVPFYNTGTGKKLGYYSDEATKLNSGDCVGSGAYSFGTTPNWADQISVAFTCYGASNTITGGNGRFGCSNGYEVFHGEDADRISSTLYLCGELCPYSGRSDTEARSAVP